MHMYNETTQMVSSVDPYMYQALHSMVGRHLAVQTNRGSVRGKLVNVMPDHIVVEVNGTPFFVRVAQIIWVLPC